MKKVAVNLRREGLVCFSFAVRECVIQVEIFAGMTIPILEHEIVASETPAEDVGSSHVTEGQDAPDEGIIYALVRELVRSGVQESHVPQNTSGALAYTLK